MPRDRRSRPQVLSKDDWLMQTLASKIQQMETGNQPPQPEKDAPWWQQGLKAAAPLLIRGIGAGQFKPEGGGAYPGIEGSMARAMKSKAKAMEDESALKQEIGERKKQEYNARNAQIINALINLKKMKTELGQQKWGREFKEKQLTQEAEIAGLRYDVKELTPEEQQAITDKHAESEAKRANIYSMIKKRNEKDPRLQALDGVDQLFKETAKNKTRNGQLVYGNVEAAWDNFLDGGGLGALEDIQGRLQTASIDMFAEQTQELSPTGEPLGFTTERTKPAPDRDNLNRLVSGLLRKAKAFEGGVVFQEPTMVTAPTTTKTAKHTETKEDAQKAFDDGNYEEAARIAALIGMPETEFKIKTD